MTEKILNQILKIRDIGSTNMFDYHTVQRIAYDNKMYELVNYIEEDHKRYCHFILYGNESDD